MATPSNLYAEKIFAEHPIALWALDDKLDYLSLITEQQRNFFDNTKWSISENAVASQQTVTLEPFIQSSTTKITADDSANTVSLISSNIKKFNQLSNEEQTFCVGFYLYDETGTISSIGVGYEYGSTGSEVQILKTLQTSTPQRWVFVSETFTPGALLVSNQDIRLVIKVNYNHTPSVTEYDFFLNGLTFGQWSENFNTTSLGVSLINFPTDIALNATKAIVADAYGLQSLNGYYISDGETVFAKNSGVPLVYGTPNTTRLSPVEGMPSLIVPGCGFLNKLGQYKTYTAEMWMRINSNEFGKERIFGPISSTDGLYVDGAFLTLKIGTLEASHFVGEWYRPMLIHIRIIPDSASLMINGEEVLSLSFSTPDLDLPEEKDSEGKSQDWLGFYSYPDVSPIDIDCVAIYPYAVPAVVAKKRWVYGQGVEFPEKINTAYSGTSVFVDYAFANYANNYIYPDIGNWNQGSYDNLTISTSSLSSPLYNLPELEFSNKTYEDFIPDIIDYLQEEGDGALNLRPAPEWADTEGRLAFDNLNLLNEDLKSFYGVFEVVDMDDDDQTLFQIVDNLSNSYFSATILNGDIVYKFKYLNLPEEIFFTQESAYSQDNLFACGLNIDTLVSKFGGNLGLFWNNKNNLKLYVGGTKDFNKTFSGKIYRISFGNAKQTYLSSTLFDEYGLVDHNSIYEYGVTSSSYTVYPKIDNETFYLDYAISGSWQDYIPLNYFAKNVLDANSDQYYDLDFIQFNIDYPKFDKFLSEAGKEFYNTTSNSVKAYVTFQTLQSGANLPLESFANTQKLEKNGIIEPGENWPTTKYEIVNNTLIYIPQNISFKDIALSVHLEFESLENVNKTVKIKSLQLASQSFSETTPTKIGTRFGKFFYPYNQSGQYFSYKEKNPFTIYKGSTPYLYLTKNTGIALKGDIDPSTNRGLSVPINENLVTDFKIIATQLSLFYDGQAFPETPTKIFEIESRDKYLKFYLEPTSPDRKRAKIYAVNSVTGQIDTTPVFYINGNLTLLPTININEWSMLGITFASPLTFRSSLGAIRINGPILINNISYYQSTNLQEIQASINRPWSKVLVNTESLDYEWSFWENFIWADVLVVSTTSSFGVDASNIYQTYTGTNKIIIDDTKVDTDSTNLLLLQDYQYNVFQNVLLQSQTINAV